MTIIVRTPVTWPAMLRLRPNAMPVTKANASRQAMSCHVMTAINSGWFRAFPSGGNARARARFHEPSHNFSVENCSPSHGGAFPLRNKMELAMRPWAGFAIAGVIIAAGFTLASPSIASPADNRALIEHATATVQDMRSDPDFGPAKNLLHKARAVLIVPGLVKGGFMFGGEGGRGVLLRREADDRWSEPAFYTLASASFGLQIGLEKAQLVMFIMSDRALRAVERDKFKLGAGAGLTVVTVGANAQAATGGNLSGDIIVWSATKGAYGGVTLEGSVIAPDHDADRRFYGQPASLHDILDDRVNNPDTLSLRQAL